MAHTIRQSEKYTSLAAFTTLAPLSVGGLLGLLVSRSAMTRPGIDWSAMVVFGIGVLALLLSLSHLGRPWRAPLAVLHLSTSWLSREVLLFGLFLLTLAGYAILPVLNSRSPALYLQGLLGAFLGLVSTIATGETYRLHSRPSWDQWITTIYFLIPALSTGLIFGFFLAHMALNQVAITSYAWVLAVFLLIASVVICSLRTFSFRLGSPEAVDSRKMVKQTHFWLFTARLITVIIAILMIWFGNGVQYLAWIPVLLGDFADRVLFFDTVIPVTLRGRYIYD